jgi:hypothetical protein
MPTASRRSRAIVATAALLASYASGGDVFGHLDANGDGWVTSHEVDSYFEKQGWLQQQDGISKFMTMQDKDGDGFISWDEFTGPKSKKAPARQPRPLVGAGGAKASEDRLRQMCADLRRHGRAHLCRFDLPITQPLGPAVQPLIAAEAPADALHLYPSGYLVRADSAAAVEGCEPADTMTLVQAGGGGAALGEAACAANEAAAAVEEEAGASSAPDAATGLPVSSLRDLVRRAGAAGAGTGAASSEGVRQCMAGMPWGALAQAVSLQEAQLPLGARRMLEASRCLPPLPSGAHPPLFISPPLCPRGLPRQVGRRPGRGARRARRRALGRGARRGAAARGGGVGEPRAAVGAAAAARVRRLRQLRRVYLVSHARGGAARRGARAPVISPPARREARAPSASST